MLRSKDQGSKKNTGLKVGLDAEFSKAVRKIRRIKGSLFETRIIVSELLKAKRP